MTRTQFTGNGNRIDSFPSSLVFHYADASFNGKRAESARELREFIASEASDARLYALEGVAFTAMGNG